MKRICSKFFFFFRVLHTICSHLRAHAIARSVTVARSSAGEEVGHRLWLPAVAIHRLGVVEIAPSLHHCFRTVHPCAQSVKGPPTEPVLSRSSRQRLGQLQSHFDGGCHVCQAVFLEPQSAAARRRVEWRDCAHEALSRLQSASSWLVMEQLVSGVCRLSCAFHAAGNSSKFVSLHAILNHLLEMIPGCQRISRVLQEMLTHCLTNPDLRYGTWR